MAASRQQSERTRHRLPPSGAHDQREAQGDVEQVVQGVDLQAQEERPPVGGEALEPGQGGAEATGDRSGASAAGQPLTSTVPVMNGCSSQKYA